MMNRMKQVSLAISAAALAIGGIAYAQMAKDHPKVDADGDGVVTRAEAQAAATAMFAKLDANKDGKLDKTDREARHAEKFTMLDTDKDGSISRQEFMARKARDGMPGPGGMGGPDGMAGPGGMHGHDGPGKDGHRGMRHGRHGKMMMLMMADADKDGAVTQAEFMAAATKRFDTADANKDGKLSKEEHDGAMAKMKADWRAKKTATPTPSATPAN